MIVLQAFAVALKSILDAPFIIQFPIGFLSTACVWMLMSPNPLDFIPRR